MLSPEEATPIRPSQDGGAGGAAGGRGRTRSWFGRRGMNEEQARQYRQRVFQMGLFVCFLLLFLDQRDAANSPPGGGNGGYGDATGAGPGGNVSTASSSGAYGGGLDEDDMMVHGIPPAGIDRLNAFLRFQPAPGAAAAAAGIDGGSEGKAYFARNVTGIYRGNWTLLPSLIQPTSASTTALPPAAPAGGKQAQEPQGGGGGLTLKSTRGKFDMPLYMNSIPGVSGLSVVYGYLKLLDGEESTDRDVYAVAKGVYLHKAGRLLLRSMSQADANNLAFTFTLPASALSGANATFQQQQQAPAAAAGEEGESGAKAAAAAAAGGGSAEWEDDDDGAGGGRRRRRRATAQEVAQGRRVAAVWHGDASRPEEDRLLAALEAVLAADPGAADASEVVGMTVLSDEAAAAGGEEVAGPDGRVTESVVIPNRSPNQYIRQPSPNGRRCTFQLDALTLPRLNASELAAGSAAPAAGGGDGGGSKRRAQEVQEQVEEPGSQSPPEEEGDLATLSLVDERLKWVEGLEGTLTSPECNLAMSVASHEAVRLDWGQAYRKAVNYSVVVTLVCVLQIALLFRQLYYSRTQAASARVSLLTVGQQAILDALLCIAHLLLCATLQPLFAAFASIAFFKLVIFSIFEIRWMFIIHQSRNSQNANAANFNGLRRQLATLHARFYAILFLLIFLIYFFANYLEVIIFLLYSFWVPQIVFNATKGVRYPLNRGYLIGMSLARLVIPLYIYGCPENFIHMLFSDYRPDYKMCIALVAWQALQVGVLLSQDHFGPQYMVPARFLPEKYNYYRAIPQRALQSRQSSGEDDAGGQGNGVGSATTSIEMTDIEGGELPECVICYNGIDVATRGSYMVAPCDHLFHRECLERWMDIKLECPVCRATLPMR